MSRLEYRAARVEGGAQRGVYGAGMRVGAAEHDGVRRPRAVSGEHGADVDLDDRPRLDLAAGTPEVGTDRNVVPLAGHVGHALPACLRNHRRKASFGENRVRLASSQLAHHRADSLLGELGACPEHRHLGQRLHHPEAVEDSRAVYQPHAQQAALGKQVAREAEGLARLESRRTMVQQYHRLTACVAHGGTRKCSVVGDK